MAIEAGLTIDDYERLPGALARHHELIDGELVEESGRTAQHNLLRDHIVARLAPFVRERQLGIIISSQGFDFNGNVYGPDVSFIRESKRPLMNMHLRVQRFVPDLAIEIVSTNDAFETLAKKAQRYRNCGTAEVWILSAETNQAFVFSEQRRAILDDRDEFRPEIIPGVAIRLGDLFSRY